MHARIFESLAAAARALKECELGFGSAGDEAAFDVLVAALLREIAVQAVVRELQAGAPSQAAIQPLVEASVAFDVRAVNNQDLDCNCYHDDVHDFAGCRGVDEAGEQCACRHQTGRVENDDRPRAEALVEKAFDAKIARELALHIGGGVEAG
jgi:hypothetical protein